MDAPTKHDTIPPSNAAVSCWASLALLWPGWSPLQRRPPIMSRLSIHPTTPQNTVRSS